MSKKIVKSKLFKNKFLVVVILVSLLPAIPFFVSHDLLHTHDGLVHLPRLAAYFRALEDGSLPVRIAGYLNYGYGLPLFNFIYQFPYWVGSLFLLLGFGLVNAFKLSLLLSFLMSGIFMYLFAKEYFEDNKKAFLITIFYQFAPFRMVELVVRGSYGEVYTYAFLPLILLGLTKILKGKKWVGILLTALGSSLLIISHNSVSLLFFGAATLFVLFTFKKIKLVMFAFGALFWGLLIASFYWIPAILDHKYTYGNLFMQELYKDHFVPLLNFFIPNLTNSSNLWTEGISSSIGLLQTIALIASVIVLMTKRIVKSNEKRILFYALSLLIASFIMMQPVSKMIWSATWADLLRQFQFPWRFLSLTTFSLSLLSIGILYLFPRLLKPKEFVILTTLTVLSVILYLKPTLGYKTIDENYYWNFPLNTTYYGETDVIWSAGPAKNYPNNPIEIISGKGEVSSFSKRNTLQKFLVKSEENIKVVSHTQYFPGWNAYVDGVKSNIEFQDPNQRGLITFDVPKGNHSVVVKFEETKTRLLADLITIFSLSTLIVISVIKLKKR